MDVNYKRVGGVGLYHTRRIINKHTLVTNQPHYMHIAIRNRMYIRNSPIRQGIRSAQALSHRHKRAYDMSTSYAQETNEHRKKTFRSYDMGKI